MKYSKVLFHFLVFIIFFLFSFDVSHAQTEDLIFRDHEYEELPDDAYIEIKRPAYKTSPAYFFMDEMITTNQVNVNEDGRNMLGDAANEPSIAIDPIDPLHMVIGWRQFDTIASNFRQAGYAYTFDGGMTWVFPGTIDPGSFRSDPVLDVDHQGKFYYNSLFFDSSQGFNCDVFKTVDEVDWDPGTYAFGGDKQWMVIDKTNSASLGNVYQIWQGSSDCDGAFNYSLDLGETFEPCSFLPVNMKKGTLAIGPSGELYASGVLGASFVISKATNTQTDADQITWDFYKNINLGGRYLFNRETNPEGLPGQVWIAVDNSNEITSGNVYLLSTVSDLDPSDIMFSRSIDGGENWSAPIRINKDEEKDEHWNWFGLMSVAPNGRIDVAWLDNRDNISSHNSSLYFSYSKDGGLTWSENKKLSEAFDPHLGYPNQMKIGDYYHMISDNESAHLAWAATFNGEQDIYYSRILVEKEVTTGIRNIPANGLFLSQNVPNPFSGSTRIDYATQEKGYLKLDIIDFLGQNIITLAEGDHLQGRYSVTWDGRDANGNILPEGMFFYKLTADAEIILLKTILFLK